MNSSLRASAAAVLSLVAGCATQAPAQLKGTATYLERMALPPGAVFEATLEDVSKADAKAEVIGTAHIEPVGNPPIAFWIPYDASRIDPKRRYALRARITVDGRPRFITDQHYPAFGPSTSEVTLTLRRVAVAAQKSDEALENTYWKLIELGGAPVVVAEQQREPHFILHPADKRASGSGGCNRITGSYTAEADRLSVGRMAGTMMACAAGMETERAFLDALQRVARTRINQQQLELLDAAGGVVARFEAVHLR